MQRKGTNPPHSFLHGQRGSGQIPAFPNEMQGDVEIIRRGEPAPPAGILQQHLQADQFPLKGFRQLDADKKTHTRLSSLDRVPGSAGAFL